MPEFNWVMYGKLIDSNRVDEYGGNVMAANPKQAAYLILANEFGNPVDANGPVSALIESEWIGEADLEDQMANYSETDMSFHIENGDLEFNIHFKLPNDVVFPGYTKSQKNAALEAVLAIIEDTFDHDEDGNRTDLPGNYSASDVVERLCGLENQIKQALTP